MEALAVSTKSDNTQHEPHPGLPATYSLLKEEKSLSIQSTNPRRTVLCFDVEYELEEAAILEAFFALFGPEPIDDYYSHLCAPRRSPNIMYIVLDFHCCTIATVNLDAIEHEVFQVEKGVVLYVDSSLKGHLANHQVSLFKRLNSIACELARRQSYTVRWGTD
jgi:hypothetical protein